MATRSIISAKIKGKQYSIYCHWDGYPEHHLPILTNFYDTDKKVLELMELGDISILAESSEKPKGHTFENPVDGYCVAYHRDRGEEYESPLGKKKKGYGEEYVYNWNGNEWTYKEV